MSEPQRTPKVFVIGPNKCATTSIHRLFNRSGISSLHWKHKGQPIVFDLLSNLTLGRRPFEGYEKFSCFTDINHLNREVCVEGAIYFREFDNSYPGSYFILNTRNVDDWVISRIKHGWLEKVARILKISEDEVISGWKKQFLEHKRNVREYFRNSKNLLEFDIDVHHPSLIADFVSDHFDLNINHWGKMNSSQGVARKNENLEKAKSSLDATRRL